MNSAKVQEQLLAAASDGQIDKVRNLLAIGASPNCQGSDGWTPLIEAVCHDPELVRVLLERGAEPNQATQHGYTALMRAAGMGRLEAVRLLLSAGANPRLRDEKGMTAYRIAEAEQQDDAAELIRDSHVKCLLSEMDGQAVRRIALAPHYIQLLCVTRDTVGGTIRRLDVTFEDSTRHAGAMVIDELVLELPVELANRKIVRVSVPFDQRENTDTEFDPDQIRRERRRTLTALSHQASESKLNPERWWQFWK